MGVHVDLPSSTRYVDGFSRFSRYTSMHYIIDWSCVVVALNSPMRIDAQSCMNVFGTSDGKYYRRIRCEMSDVAFRAGQPIGGLSCCRYCGYDFRLAEYSDVISIKAVEDDSLDVCVNFGCSR